MKSLLTLFASLLFCASFASAQSPREPDEMREIMKVWPTLKAERGTETAYEGLRDFTTCLIVRDPRSIQQLLLLDPADEQLHSAISAISKANEDCLSRLFLKFGQGYFRAALIESLYLKDFPATKPGRVTMRLGPAAPDLHLARCLVEAQPGLAERLVRTKHVSSAQRKVFAQLAPAISKCMQPGVESSEPQMLQYRIAEALYRRADGPMAGAAE